MGTVCTIANRLLAGAALRVFQVGLAPFGLGTLGLTDIERAAAQVFGFVGFVFCQSDLLEKWSPYSSRPAPHASPAISPCTPRRRVTYCGVWSPLPCPPPPRPGVAFPRSWPLPPSSCAPRRRPFARASRSTPSA